MNAVAGLFFALLLFGGAERAVLEMPSLTPVVPGKSSDFAPSFARLLASETYDPGVHNEIRSCHTCHPEHVAQWQTSLHAFSSFNNPLYRVAFDDYIAEAGQERAAFCGGCHDPSLLFGEGLEKTVAPEDPRGHLGVTCMGCHGVSEVTADGVGSYTLSTAPIPLPKEGDAPSLAAHRRRLGGPALKSGEICTSCHRGFLSEESGHSFFVPALDEPGPWRRSGYGGSSAGVVKGESGVTPCVDCHMPLVSEGEGMHSHLFTGGHTTFAAMMGDSGLLEAQRTFLMKRVEIDVPVWGRADGEPRGTEEPLLIKPGSVVFFDVVISNLGVGHFYPGGARDLRDAWVEVELRDAAGVVVARSVEEAAAGGPPKERVHRLNVGMVDSTGRALKTHDVGHFRTAAYDNTIAPNDARGVRFHWTVPPGWRGGSGLQIQARLVERRVSQAFYARSCEAGKGASGAAFLKATFRLTGHRIDPCAPQPVVEMASSSLQLGVRGSGGGPAWRRWYRHGLALRHAVSERQAEAEASLIRALKGAPAGEAAVAVRTALLQVRLRQGRSDEVLGELEGLARRGVRSAALDALWGDALAHQWRYREAAERYGSAALEAPLDDSLWRRLSVALGGSGEWRAALLAAQRGLKLEPRDVDLLRVQLQALVKLSAKVDAVLLATRAFEEFRRDGEAGQKRAECGRQDPACWLERDPFHGHVLRSVSPLRGAGSLK